MFGMWDQRKEYQERQRVRPPKYFGIFAAGQERRQVGDHQDQNQQRDHTRFIRQRTQPLRPNDKSAESKTSDADGYRYTENSCQPKIKRSEEAVARQRM